MRLKESINQNQINLLKATYGDIKKINPNSPAVKKLMMVLKKLPKDDLEMISKAKINFVSTMAQSILRDSNLSESTDIDNLQKRKTDLLKQVDPLIAKKKKLYSDVDITTPKSSDEKKLDKEIADLFSEINDLVHKIAKLKKSQNEGKHTMKLKSVNEAIAVGKMVKVVDNPHWEASLGKKGPFKRKVKMIDGDNVFFTDGSNSSMKYVKEDTQLTNEADLNWNLVQAAIINFLKVNTKILDKRVQAKDTEGVKGGLKSIISGLTNAQRNLNLESVNEASYTVKAENPYQFVNGAYAVLSAYLRDEELGPKGKRELQSILKSLDYMRKYFYSNMNESVNEAKKSKDVKGIRAVEAVSNNVDAIIDLVLYENRDPKEVIDTMAPVLLNAIKETIKHKYKPSSADPSNAKKLNEFLSEIKKFQKLVEDLLNRPSKAGVKKIEDAWKNIWNHKHGANIILNGKRYDSIIESAKKSTFTKVARISNNGKLDIY